MSTLSKEELKELIDHIDDICVSMFMPTQAIHREQQQAEPVLLRNLIDEARTEIGRFSAFMRYTDIEQLLQPALQIVHHDGDFWKHQAGGLAIFLGTDFSRVYQLPLSFEPLVMVSGRFYIRPLLPLLTAHGRFYLLALSQNQVRLLQATEDQIEEINVHDIPTSLEQVLAYDNPQKEIQFRGGAGTSAAVGRRSTFFYSVDIPANYQKESLLRYCQQINNGLQRYLRHETSPLILACVNYLFAIYQQANSYPYLSSAYIPGSPDRLSDRVLHQKAWTLVQPTLQHARQNALTKFGALLRQRQASTAIRRVVAAAFQGRVETLFVDSTVQQWGSLNQKTGEVDLHEYPITTSQELLNLAAMYTLSNNGTVYVLQPEELSPEVKLAAVFRY